MMVVKKQKASPMVFNKMIELIFVYYTGPKLSQERKSDMIEECCANYDLEEFK